MQFISNCCSQQLSKSMSDWQEQLPNWQSNGKEGTITVKVHWGENNERTENWNSKKNMQQTQICMGVKKPYLLLKKKIFQRACRIILGPKKLVLRLVWSTFAISFDWCSIIFVPTIVIWHWEEEPSYKNKNRSYRKKISIDHVAPQTPNYDWKWEPCLDLKYIFSLSHQQLFDSFESNPSSPNPKEKEGQYQNKQSVNFLSPVTVVLLPKEKWGSFFLSPKRQKGVW